MDKLTCVIIEDEKEFIDLLTHYLKKIEGIEIVGAYGDTVTATIQIERLKPDIVFLDINISGLEGPEFVELLDHKPKIVVISGHVEAFMKHYPEVAYVDFIQKPPTLEKLIVALDKCRAQ